MALGASTLRQVRRWSWAPRYRRPPVRLRTVASREHHVEQGVFEEVGAYDRAVPAVAIATFSGAGDDWPDDGLLAAALRTRGASVERIAWDAPGIDWATFDVVVIRSTWDYTARFGAFVAWADGVGERLHNAPALIRWNGDKRYLADLDAAGLPVVPTTYVAPGDPVPALAGDVVVKPSVSAGAKDSGRFGPGAHAAAAELIERIHRSRRTVMVQPYLASVDTRGETAVVCIDGSPAYTLHKRAVLRPDEVAPVRADELGAAEAMYDPDLVVPGAANRAQLALARQVVDHVSERFGSAPLYARVDMVAGPDGAPVLLELEAVEPNLYLDQIRGSADLVADAVMARAIGSRPVG